MEKRYRELGDRVAFIAINLGVRKDIGEYLKKNNLTFPVVYDEGDRIAKLFDAKIQTTILIDRRGVIIYDEREIPDDKYIDELLK